MWQNGATTERQTKMNTTTLIEAAKKAVKRLTTRDDPYTLNHLCVFAQSNDGGWYDIWVGPGVDAGFTRPCICVSEHHTDIGLHAEADANEAAAACGVLSEKAWKRNYSQD
jgi:hypothetical protein